MKSAGSQTEKAENACPDCRQPLSQDAKFCPSCGHQILVFQQCLKCSKNLPPHAQFCLRCGAKVAKKSKSKKCPHCGTKNLTESLFCNQCGERLKQ